ncbi:hypothetical protein JQX13_45010 [Archangium violaceum]|uniref:hypothetical protein n=1 Tax=Archangium violaceum TaxID=83451 RepID=UPI00193B9704|nr:hypothetical protein [Archangium violaceum]QRK07137.1 hypothetical protein JQX13_45010 [Archangium violaceum]
MRQLLNKAWLWVWSYLLVWALVIVASIIKRVRMSHNNGLVGMGRLTLVDNPAFPAHDFFQPGREFRCRLRHASVTYPDDAALQVRAATLKFENSQWESPLDLEMNTGTTSLFWSARTFLEFFWLQHGKGWVSFVPYYKKYPDGLRAAREGVRDLPSSFALMRYHSQTPTLFLARDGVTRYVKYRLIPEDPSQPETGIPSPERAATVWDARPPAGETPNRTYLKDEYAQRVAAGPVVYRLQLQLHTASAGDSPEIFNSNKAWDEATHPWMELARVEITQVGTWQEAVLTRSSIHHAPPSLASIPANSMDDYNSVNTLRGRSTWVKRVRIFMDTTFGTPPRPSSQRVQGDNPWY